MPLQAATGRNDRLRAQPESCSPTIARTSRRIQKSNLIERQAGSSRSQACADFAYHSQAVASGCKRECNVASHQA